jgi:ring-1,2-phenylacetyl-CoA epoxidase subunit PaaC
MDTLPTFLLALADDELMMGHRASEWTGLGPLLEADLALSSIAQDEMGHALLLYTLLHEGLGLPDPDQLVYYRPSAEFRNAIFCELPRGDWGEAVVRHFLYDLAEQIRWEALTHSTYAPLATIAKKILPEERYHLIHGQTWMKRLAQGTEESHKRMQAWLDALLPHAVALWEPVPNEVELVNQGITLPSNELEGRWWNAVTAALGTVFVLPPLPDIDLIPGTGGRTGDVTEYRSQLVDAMQLLHKEMPGTKW